MRVGNWKAGVVGTGLLVALTACQDGDQSIAPLEQVEDLRVEAEAPSAVMDPAEAPTWETGVSLAPVPCRPFSAPDGLADRALSPSARGTPEPEVCSVQEAPALSMPLVGEGLGPEGEALSSSALTLRATGTGGIPTMLSAGTLPAPTGHSPTGQVGTVRPTFQWDAVNEATSYLVFIRDSGTLGSGPPRVERWVTAETAGCPNSTDSCAWVVDTHLMEGEGRWWVRGWNPTDEGVWSSTINFSISASGPLPGPVLTGPTGTVDNRRPTLHWQALQGSTWYQVFVRDSETVSGPAKVQKWVTVDETACGSELGSCGWALDRDLASGEVRWWVRGWQASSGNGAWSAQGAFQVDAPPSLATPTARSPSGVITANQPEFSWDAVAGANWYRVFIRDGATNTGAPRVDRWVRATDAGCGSGTGVCSWPSDTPLSPGDGIWWVLAWNDAALSGPWSAGRSFTVPPPPTLQAPVTVGPTGATAVLRPTLEWQSVAGATSYLVFLRDSDTRSGSPKIELWIGAAAAGCGAGSGTCQWTVNADLAGGEVQWWIRGWNEAVGDGPWSSTARFDLTVGPAPLPPEVGNPFRGDVMFVERFDDMAFRSRGWFDSSGGLVVPGGAVGSDGTHALLCRFEAGGMGCADGTPGRMSFDASESVFLSYRIRYDDGWVGSGRSYHPHEFYLLTNADDRFVGPARTHLTVYVEQVGGTPLISLQDSRNVDTRCILRNNDSLVGCSGFSIHDFPFGENRSVAACNGLLGDVQGRDCYPTGAGWYSMRTWRAEQPVLQGPGPNGSDGWRLVEAFVEMNSIVDGRGLPDGRIRLWVDGELVVSSDRILLRTGQHPGMAFNQLLFAPHIGDGSPVGQSFRIGEIVVARGAPN